VFRTFDCNVHEYQASERFELEIFGKEAIILPFITLLRGNPSKVTGGVSHMDVCVVVAKKTKRYGEQEEATTKILCAQQQ